MNTQESTPRRFDERDTIFSRMRLVHGSDVYREYYELHPEREETDRILRDHPPGTMAGLAAQQAVIEGRFAAIEAIRNRARTLTESQSLSAKATGEDVKALMETLTTDSGAFFACGTLPESVFYSVRGRGPAYGVPVSGPERNAIVILMPMRYGEIITAPGIHAAMEVSRVYLLLASLAVSIQTGLESLGYTARAHIDGESEIILPPAAAALNLGVIGRHGLLMTDTWGPAVRLAAVTTNAPLPPSPPAEPAIKHPCDHCAKCAQMCPSRAIPEGSLPKQAPLGGWVSHEKCFTTWKELATDCGICIAACPHTHKQKKTAQAPAEDGAFNLKAFLYRGTDQ